MIITSDSIARIRHRSFVRPREGWLLRHLFICQQTQEVEHFQKGFIISQQRVQEVELLSGRSTIWANKSFWHFS